MNYSNQYSAFISFYGDSTAHASSQSKQSANYVCTLSYWVQTGRS